MIIARITVPSECHTWVNLYFPLVKYGGFFPLSVSYLLCNTKHFFWDHRSRWWGFTWFQMVPVWASRAPAWGVTFPQHPLPPPLLQRSCLGQALQNLTYMTCKDRFTIHFSGAMKPVHRKRVCACIFWCNLMLGEEAALSPKPHGWGALGALLGDWSTLWAPGCSAEQRDAFFFCPW